MSPDQHRSIIQQAAAQCGFSYCGISAAAFLEKEAKELEAWLQQGLHGKMQYMENHFDKRVDPSKLVPGAQSVISLMYNYYPPVEQSHENGPKIARYAYGEDYHFVVKDKLREMVSLLEEKIGQFTSRIFVDSAPVLEKAWAKKSGLGWQGKNTNIIHPKSGSYFFLAEIICDISATPDGPIKDYCGTCTACIDACPTDALYEPYKIDASRCISYLTIELKDELIPETFHNKMEGWAFGCDICQEVCPWNRFSTPHTDKRLAAKEAIISWNTVDWQEITEEVFKQLFKDSPISRPKWSGFNRNLQFLQKAP